MKSYKDLIEEFIPDHVNKHKLLDALETRALTTDFEGSDNGGVVKKGDKMAIKVAGKVVKEFIANPVTLEVVEDPLEVPAENCGSCKHFGFTPVCNGCSQWHNAPPGNRVDRWEKRDPSRDSNRFPLNHIE